MEISLSLSYRVDQISQAVHPLCSAKLLDRRPEQGIAQRFNELLGLA